MILLVVHSFGGKKPPGTAVNVIMTLPAETDERYRVEKDEEDGRVEGFEVGLVEEGSQVTCLMNGWDHTGFGGN